MDETAGALVAFTASVRFDALPPSAVHAARRVLVDSVGCAVAAAREPTIIGLQQLAQGFAGRTGLLCADVGTTPDMAAFVNGAMVRWKDFNDDYFGGSGDLGPHPSDNLGGILAAAELAGADGRGIVEGVIVAYEVVCQLIDQVQPLGRKRTWDYTVFHAAATALAAGRLLGLTRDQLSDALSLAVVPNLALNQTRNGELSQWKGLAGPYASRAGLFAALLARAGIAGPPEPFAGRAGLAAHLGNPFPAGPLPGQNQGQNHGQDQPYKVESICVKSLPVRYTNQLPTQIALELHPRLAGELAAGAVESVTVYGLARDVVTREAFPHQWAPSSRETADHSLPYLVAAALVDGSITEQTFSPERYGDPGLRELMLRIEFRGDPRYTAAFPGHQRGRIEVALSSGQVVTLEQSDPLGHPANPMSDDQLTAKFLGQTAGILPDAAAQGLLDRLWALEKQPSAGELLTATRALTPA
jgi:2-methylcitrate dehydratase